MQNITNLAWSTVSFDRIKKHKKNRNVNFRVLIEFDCCYYVECEGTTDRVKTSNQISIQIISIPDLHLKIKVTVLQ